jgi:hypothetical protein
MGHVEESPGERVRLTNGYPRVKLLKPPGSQGQTQACSTPYHTLPDILLLPTSEAGSRTSPLSPSQHHQVDDHASRPYKVLSWALQRQHAQRKIHYIRLAMWRD